MGVSSSYLPSFLKVHIDVEWRPIFILMDPVCWRVQHGIQFVILSST
jgi:hypothetical protein